jgi:hypothetical protein
MKRSAVSIALGWLDRLNAAFWFASSILLVTYALGIRTHYLMALVIFLAPFGIGTGFKPNLNTQLVDLKSHRKRKPYFLIGFAVLVAAFWSVAAWLTFHPEALSY